MENISIINFKAPFTGNVFADLILWLVSITSSVAAGVVLFTLFLKLITLPFDFISRFSMRKNSIKMEQMRPELEKLQKQYADNKNLYNQKMMALYKKNGYSMFGACLPTIITLVIFIIAINGFNAYSRFQNKQYIYDMSVAYNNVIYAGLETDGTYISRDEEGNLIINDELLLEMEEGTFTPEGKDFTVTITKGTENVGEEERKYYTVKTENGYIEYKRYYKDQNTVTGNADYKIITDKLDATSGIATKENNYLKNTAGKTFAEAKAENSELTATKFLEEIGAIKAAEVFKSNGSGFLWVKNIWATDSPMAHPVEANWDTFKSKNGVGNLTEADIGSENYNKLIAGLENEKTAPNGYFILVVLTALSSLVTQLVIGKSQKAQMELQTVDGQGAQTQKIMMWMMPIMMAVFAFIYTAAFSIYIILSSLISLGTTLLINFIADKKFKKSPQGDGDVIHGRVYVPTKEQAENKPVKKKDKNKTPENDFFSGLADKKKHYRGRIK